MNLPLSRDHIALSVKKMSRNAHTGFRMLSSLPVLALALLMLVSPVILAAADSPAVVRGRVLDTTNGNYIRNALVSVVDTNITALTDDYGEYILANVPPGEVTVRASYGMLEPQQQRVSAVAGQTVVRDFNLKASSKDDDVVVLDAYTVQSHRERDAKMIALNEQRFAGNIKNVVSADEFGDVTEGNIGEFMKFLPGVVIDYNAADARTISVRGLPPSATAITMDGGRVASASSGASSRVFEFEQVSINNTSRVEVTKTPTPDVPADTLGGSVNIVSKSSFERAKPYTVARVYLSMNNTAMTTGSEPIGPDGNSEHVIKPGFDFTHINPLTKNFGIVVTGLYSNQYNPETLSQTNWLPGGGSAPSSSPATVTGTSPYLGSWRVQTSPKVSTRSSVGITLDWKPTSQDVLSLRYQYNTYDTNFYALNYSFDTALVASGTSFGPDYTIGATDRGSANSTTGFRHKYGSTWTTSLGYKHNGPVWKIEAGANVSQATNHYRDIDDGYFNSVNAAIRNVTVKFYDVTSVKPGRMELSKAGVAIDPFDLTKNYRLITSDFSTNANGYTGAVGTNQRNAVDMTKQFFANARRDFNWRVPVTVKTGLDYRQQTRDIKVDNRVFKYFGADGTENTADDGASPYLNNSYATLKGPFGIGHVTWLDPKKVYNTWLKNDAYLSEVLTGNYSRQILSVNGSQFIKESVFSAYIRGDIKFFNNRLWLIGGVRFEETKDDAEGPLNDANALYKIDPATGKPVNPLTYVDSLTGLTGTALTIAQNKLRYQERGSKVSRNYDGLYPSLNASYTILDNLILRAAYARTIGRPDFDKIIPGTSVPIPDPSGQTTPTITVKNTGLKPWQANSYDLSLEYYFLKNSRVGLSLFRKEISDFFGDVEMDATPELLEQYGLDPVLYANYRLKTTRNVGDMRVTGLEFDYSQQLTFLPSWARGFSVFANGTWLRLKGNRESDFSSFIPRTMNWGVSYNRQRVSIMLKWVHRGDQRTTLRAVSATNRLLPDTYEYVAGSTKLDINAEVRINKWFSLFGNARNVTNEPYVLKRYAPGTPEYARTYSTQEFGVQMVVGAKATF